MAGQKSSASSFNLKLGVGLCFIGMAGFIGAIIFYVMTGKVKDKADSTKSPTIIDDVCKVGKKNVCQENFKILNVKTEKYLMIEPNTNTLTSTDSIKKASEFIAVSTSDKHHLNISEASSKEILFVNPEGKFLFGKGQMPPIETDIIDRWVIEDGDGGTSAEMALKASANPSCKVQICHQVGFLRDNGKSFDVKPYNSNTPETRFYII